MNDRLEIASRLEAAQVQFQGKLSDCDPLQCLKKADRLIAIERESRPDEPMHKHGIPISHQVGEMVAGLNKRIAELEGLLSIEKRCFETLKLQEIGAVIGLTARDNIPPAILPWVKDAKGRIDSIEAREIACDKISNMVEAFRKAGLSFSMQNGRPHLTFADRRGDSVVVSAKVIDAAKAVVEHYDADVLLSGDIRELRTALNGHAS